MANLRRQQDFPGVEGGFGADEPSPDEGRQQVMPVPALGQIHDEGGDPSVGGGDVARRPIQKGQSGETPREREQAQQGNLATPRQLDVPTLMAGTESPAMSGVIPFQPMGGPNPADQASPRLRSLYGGSNGLTGGGLGVPLDPISNQQSDPITELLKILQGA